MKVGTHEKPYRTFVGNAIYVSVPGLIDPRVNVRSPRWENVEWSSRVCHGSLEPLHSLYFRKNWKFVPVRVAKEGVKLH